METSHQGCIMRKVISKEVTAGGRFDLFLDSAKARFPYVNLQVIDFIKGGGKTMQKFLIEGIAPLCPMQARACCKEINNTLFLCRVSAELVKSFSITFP